MAEYVERKFTAAKLSVAFAVAALLGGLAARDQSAGAASAGKGAEPHLSHGSITSAEIKNESLLFKDIKPGQVYSDDQLNQKWLKISDASAQYLKIDEANDTFVKIEDANNAFVKIEDANKAFVKIEDAAHQFINGDGKVISGFEVANGTNPVTVLEATGFVRALGVPGSVGGPQPHLRMTNLGSTPLHYGTGGGAGVIAPGASADVNLPQGGGAATVQLTTEESTPTVGTLTMTAIPAGQALNFSAQVLIGAGQ